MPIEYEIITREGARFSLNSADTEDIRRGSLTQGPDQLRLKYDKIQGQSVPGTLALGPSRADKRELKLTAKIADSDQRVYSLQVNRIMSACSEAVEIASNFATAKVRCTKVGIKYGAGQLKKGVGDIEATFDFLDPYWERFPPTVYHFKVAPRGITNIGDTVARLVPVGAKLQLDASGGVINSFVFFRSDTNEALKIVDSDFGKTVQQSIYNIDCKEGTVLLGERDRTSKIAPGSGFFQMPLAPGKLRVYNSGPGDLSGTLTEPNLIYV